MNSITEFFDSIKAIYIENKTYANYIGKILIFFFVFLSVLKSNYTYSFFGILSSTFIVIIISIILSLISATLDIRIFMVLFTFCVPISLTSSLGISLVTLILLVSIFILFGSISKESCFIIALTICMSYLKIPYIVPVYLGVSKNKKSILPMLIGLFTFFFVKGANNYLLFNPSIMQEDFIKQIAYGCLYIMSFMLSSSTFIVSLITFAFVVLLINALKYFYIENGMGIAIAISYVVFLITFILNNLIINTGESLFLMIIFILVSFVISFFLYLLNYGIYDYKKTQKVFFKDEENIYYVQIVPKDK